MAWVSNIRATSAQSLMRCWRNRPNGQMNRPHPDKSTRTCHLPWPVTMLGIDENGRGKGKYELESSTGVKVWVDRFDTGPVDPDGTGAVHFFADSPGPRRHPFSGSGRARIRPVINKGLVEDHPSPLGFFLPFARQRS